MQHWSLLVTRNWRSKPARSALAVLAAALGVGVVVWVTCCYESVRRKVTDVVLEWIGRSHIVLESPAGVWGFYDEDVLRLAGETSGVQYATANLREYVEIAADRKPSNNNSEYARIEVTGVLPESELRFRTYKLAAGRFLSPSDQNAIVIERLLAKELGVAVGDHLRVRHHATFDAPQSFKIVGIIDRRRASLNQPPMTWANLKDVQALADMQGRIKSIDIMVADPTTTRIRAVAESLEEQLAKRNKLRKTEGLSSQDVVVKTTEAQHQKLGAAQGLLRFIMMLLSCAVLLTAFFIIVATMSMGVTERITELGLMRCVGLTRMQLSAVLLLQTVPLGVAGVVIGLPLGFALQWLTIWFVPEYVGAMAVSRWGIALAVGGGLGATLLGAAFPALSAFAVTPVEAAREHAGDRARRWIGAIACVGVSLIVAHELAKRSMSINNPSAFDARAILSLVLLYGGSAMLAPAVVVMLGRVAVRIAAAALRLKPQLLGDEIGKAPYRSAAICCGLMVGLSLIVGLVVWGKSVKQGWEFPKEFPDALLYTYSRQPLEDVRALAKVNGVRDFTATADFPFSLKAPSTLGIFKMFQGLDQFSRFLAIDPDEGLNVVKLAFVEGNEVDAKEKLKQGQHILITREFANARSKHLGDKLSIWVQVDGGEFKKATFRIAGVVASPGLDIAISFFNATSYFQTYAVGAIIGTLDDAERLFGLRFGSLMLFNFDFKQIDATRIEADSSQALPRPSKTSPTGRPTFMLGEGPIPGDGPEERIVNAMLEKLDYPPKAFVTARELKYQIDNNINRVTLLLSAIPFVGLIVAALGLANLMAANVASRSKQIAVLRALGATRNQIARIIMGEAFVLGLIGSGLGLALGITLGRTSNTMTTLLSGFEPTFSIPWSLVLGGAALATGLCLLAAMIPARYAARSNIVSVLSDL